MTPLKSDRLPPEAARPAAAARFARLSEAGGE
jgi:hypothetical protein